MKRLLKICSLLLVMCLALCGCGSKTPNGGKDDDNSGANNGGTPPVNTVTPQIYPEVTGMTHDYKITETDGFIVKDGASEYRILVPEGKADDKFISAASSDLKQLFSEATGIMLPVVEDNVDLSGGKFLAIGDTKLASNESLGADEKTLGKGGVRIKTVGNSVCMTGATTEAAMYAAYVFLEQALNFEQFYTDFYSLDKDVTELKLMNYDVTDIPDFEYRIQSAGFIRWNDANMRRMRWTNNEALFIPADEQGATWHNTFVYLPPDTYREEHPDWYSSPWRKNEKSNQLCYTAHGNEAEREKMIEIIADRIKELFSMDKYKGYDWISVSIEDNQNCCTCETCAAEKAKYGVDSAVMVKFLNEVSKRVGEWMETPEGAPHKRENYRIFFFAYHATNAAPARYDEETGKYVPIDESVICDDHVVTYFAETNGDYTQNFHDAGTANTDIGKNMLGWAALSKEIYFWSYSTNFSHFLTPYNSFDTVQDILKFSKNAGSKYVMIQDQWIQQSGQTGFGIYKNWLHSKLLWDVNADVNALTDKFFDAYFGKASATMRKLFDEWRVWARYQTEELGYNGYRSVYYNALDAKLWPQRMLSGWLDLTEQAKADIAEYKDTEPELYGAITDHIAMESLSFRYLLISLYSSQYSSDALVAMQKQFASDVERIGMNLVNSVKQDTIADLIKSWGI